jgi:carnitine-CoA ligase
VSYTGKDRTVVRVLRDQVARAPDKALLHTPSGELSRVEIDRISNRLARGLSRAGVERGDPVLLLLGNTELYVFAWLALAKLGAIEVPVNAQYRGKLLVHAVNAAGAKVLLTDIEHIANVAEIERDLLTLQMVAVSGQRSEQRAPPHGLPGVPLLAGDADEGREAQRALPHGLPVVSLEELIDVEDAELGNDPAYSDVVALMYTSGTTGPSKGVLVTHAHAYEYANAVREALELTDTDVYYAPLPLFHIAGQWAVVYASLMSGGSAVIKPKFSVSEFWLDVERSRASTSFLLGAMANFLYRQPAQVTDPRNTLSRILMSPLVPELDRFKRRFGVEVATAYGSTEANVPILSGFEIQDPRQCGRARRGWQVAIVDEDDELAPAGEAGEIVVRPPEPWLTMKGYLGNAQASAEAYRNCWLHTGDRGYADADGNFYFLDRMSDAIRRRGENISSFEVEREVNAHPCVLESAAVGVASEHTEEEVMVYVVARAGQALEPRQLHEFLCERAPSFMVPRYIRIVDALPKTDTGKVQKALLRELPTSASWDAEAARTSADEALDAGAARTSTDEALDTEAARTNPNETSDAERARMRANV